MIQKWATAAANQPVSITVGATPDKVCVIHGVQWSYSKNGTGRLTIKTDIETLLDLDITRDGVDEIISQIESNYETNITVTLLPGGQNIIGKLSIQYTIDIFK